MSEADKADESPDASPPAPKPRSRFLRVLRRVLLGVVIADAFLAALTLVSPYGLVTSRVPALHLLFLVPVASLILLPLPWLFSLIMVFVCLVERRDQLKPWLLAFGLMLAALVFSFIAVAPALAALSYY